MSNEFEDTEIKIRFLNLHRDTIEDPKSKNLDLRLFYLYFLLGWREAEKALKKSRP